jgi:dTDP-4-amino-4,6-dideoxygalactose transaminase
MRRIPFVSLAPAEDAAAIRAAIDRVIARGWFVLGPEVDGFETEFAAAMGASFAAPTRLRSSFARSALVPAMR